MKWILSLCAFFPLLVAHAVAGQQLSTWRLAPDLRIGAVDDPNLSFTIISDLEVSPDGKMFIAESADRQIRVFDPAGRFLYAIGRDGDGPGEFRRLDQLVFADSGLWVLDKQRRRLSGFTLAGKFISSSETVRHQFAPGIINTPPIARLSNGKMLVVPAYDIRTVPPITKIPVLVASSAGDDAEYIATLDVEGESRQGEAGDLKAAIPQPVNSISLWTLPRDMNGILIVHRRMGDSETAGEFQLIHIGSDGDTILSKKFRVRTESIPPDAAQDSLELLIDRNTKGRPFPRDRIAALMTSGWSVPPFQAPVDQIVAGTDGSIWVRRGAFGLDEVTWWVIDRRGILVASLSVPAQLRILRVSETYVWGTDKGEFDEPYVVRMRVLKR